MTKDELETGLKAVEKERTEKRNALYIKYMDENAQAKIGDIVSCGKTTILVSMVKIDTSWNCVEIYYVGKMLRKDLQPYVNGETNTVWEYSPAFKIVRKASDDTK